MTASRPKQPLNENKRSFHICSSSSSFSSSSGDKQPACAEVVNRSLNLNLGLGIDPMSSSLRYTCKILSDAFSLFEEFLFYLWLCIPLVIRHNFTLRAWGVFLIIHRKLIGRRSGIHPDASEEYHAFTSIAWWTRLFPMTTRRMRFGLNQIEVWVPPTGKAHSTERVDCKETGASGIYVQINDAPSIRVIFWLYGGAYLSGDCQGNLGTAEMVARETGCDVFLAEYRLLPEHEFADCIKDAHDAYTYLLNVKKAQPKNVFMFGISSGGGIAIYLMQDLAKSAEDKLPRAAVLMCPFVEYTEPKGSLVHYVKHDLIVTQSVYAVGIPYLAEKLGSHDNRVKESPVFRPFESLPPLCVVISEHECCFDMTVSLVNNARAQGVKVDIAVWKYLCHVFPMLSAMIPEGKEAIHFMCEWIKEH